MTTTTQEKRSVLRETVLQQSITVEGTIRLTVLPVRSGFSDMLYKTYRVTAIQPILSSDCQRELYETYHTLEVGLNRFQALKKQIEAGIRIY